MRAAVYVRSTSGASTQEQSERCREAARAVGAQIVETIVDDRVSGANLDRPGLVLLRAALERRAVDAVIVARRDRLSRDPLQLRVLNDEIEQHGVRLLVVDEIAANGAQR